jgi:aspartate dehydrogenase
MHTRLVILGYGAIAAELIGRLCEREACDLQLAVWLRPGSASASRVPAEIRLLESVADVLKFAPDLVVEAAGHAALAAHAEICLAAGITVLAVSVGALADDTLLQRLKTAARRGRSQLKLASGAIGSLDYLQAVRAAANLQVNYESRKPPAAWADELRSLGLSLAPQEPVLLFEGDARDAAQRYPQNLNVAASLALAGIGFERTQVRIVVDPQARGNSHHITASGAFGEIRTAIVNRPSAANPKTSQVVGLSLLAAIERHFSPVVFA